jgi:Na+:H+ antiporter, NhaA family
MLGTLGHRVALGGARFRELGAVDRPAAAADRAGGSPRELATFGPAFEELWEQYFGFSFGERAYRMSLRHWINDGLLTVFFLVVGLEIKREFTVGHLANRRAAALPIAAAIGGMAVPALLYLLVIPQGPGRAAGACRWRPTPRSPSRWSR